MTALCMRPLPSLFLANSTCWSSVYVHVLGIGIVHLGVDQPCSSISRFVAFPPGRGFTRSFVFEDIPTNSQMVTIKVWTTVPFGVCFTVSLLRTINGPQWQL